MFLLRLVKALETHRVDYAIVGGYAVALHGAVRGTVDIDLVIKLTSASYSAAELALKSLGLQSRIPVSSLEVFKFRKEYIANRNLIAWSFANSNNPTEVVDIVLTHDLSRLRTKVVKVNGIEVKILAIQDLIKMKKASARPQDIEDIKVLEKL